MFEKIIQLIKQDYKLGVLIIALYAIYHLFGLYNADKVMDIEEKKNCETEKKELQKKLDSANSTILSIYQLKSLKNDTSR